MKQLLLIILVSCSLNGFAQNGIWKIHINDLIDPFGFSVAKDGENYVIAGVASGTNYNSFYCWITEMDADFDPIWHKSFELSGQHYQATPHTIVLSVINHDNILLLAKSYNTDSSAAYTELLSLRNNGDLNWARKWKQTPFSQWGNSAYDLNKIIPLLTDEFFISHSAGKGTFQSKLDLDGNVLTSKYTYDAVVADTNCGVFNLRCSDDGWLQIHKLGLRKSIVVKLDGNYEVEWAREIGMTDESVWMSTAFENPDGSFWLFGTITHYFPEYNDLEDALGTIKISATGEVLEAWDYPTYTGESLGLAQLFPTGENQFDFNTVVGGIGKLDLNTSKVEFQKLDLAQANHDFQNMHKLPNGYAMTGMGANWEESKIHFFPAIDNHPCLLLYTPQTEINGESIPLEHIVVTNAAMQVEDFSFGQLYDPGLTEFVVFLSEECNLAVDELSSVISMNVFPNPVTSGKSITIQLDNTVINREVSVTIVDLQGKIVQSKVFDHSAELNYMGISGIPPGLYFVKCSVEGNQKVPVFKLIVE